MQVPIVLYSYELSPYAAKVRCFLGRKDLDYTTHYVDPLHATAELPVGHQVPVLAIGDEARNDSTPIGMWLDERFPDKPRLLPDASAERERVLALDEWVTRRLIPLTFRLMLGEGESLATRWRNRRRGARTLHKTVPNGYRFPWRALHPLMVTRAGFIRRVIAETDPRKSNASLLTEVLDQLSETLGPNPFLGGQNAPTLADLSAFAQLAFPYLAGYDGIERIERNPRILAWLERVRSHLPPEAPLREDLWERRWAEDVATG